VKQRYATLDALRGVLIVLIVAQHVYWFVSGGHEWWWAHKQYAINGFVILMGFTASMSLAKDPPYWQFVHKRLAGIFPLYLIALASALLVNLLTGAPDATPAQLLTHLIGIHGLIPEWILPHASTAILPSGWFITFLIQFYLLAPLLGRLSDEWLWRILGLSLVVFLHPLQWRLFIAFPLSSFMPMKLYLLVIGMLLHRYWPDFGRWPAPRPLVWLGLQSLPIFLFNFQVCQLFLHE
jgi:peptidoglycan/LPS O-acetylase OafA/YrhL